MSDASFGLILLPLAMLPQRSSLPLAGFRDRHRFGIALGRSSQGHSQSVPRGGLPSGRKTPTVLRRRRAGSTTSGSVARWTPSETLRRFPRLLAPFVVPYEASVRRVCTGRREGPRVRHFRRACARTVLLNLSRRVCGASWTGERGIGT